jgi:hypothetical protein
MIDFNFIVYGLSKAYQKFGSKVQRISTIFLKNSFTEINLCGSKF